VWVNGSPTQEFKLKKSETRRSTSPVSFPYCGRRVSWGCKEDSRERFFRKPGDRR